MIETSERVECVLLLGIPRFSASSDIPALYIHQKKCGTNRVIVPYVFLYSTRLFIHQLHFSPGLIKQSWLRKSILTLCNGNVYALFVLN